MLISILMLTLASNKYSKCIINLLDILEFARNDTLFVFLIFLVPKICLFEYYAMYNLPLTILKLPPTPAQRKM